MVQVFIQMSGAPGSGKTTIANAIARCVDAVIIDHDITKSALLDADVPISIAGRASYEVLGALAEHLLKQGHSVIFDSPCFYEELLERGQRLAREAGAAYLYIECIVKDLDELDRRLRSRPSLRSQRVGVFSPPIDGTGEGVSGDVVFADWIANMKRPEAGYLVLDTTRSLEVCIDEAMEYTAKSRIDAQEDGEYDLASARPAGRAASPKAVSDLCSPTYVETRRNP
jgi:predicted kinase